jgi:flagellin
MTQQSLTTVQNQVSTGLAVANASDNAAYWSIATQLNSDSTMITAANSAISQSQAILDTASTAISSVITTINAIQTTLTEATNPGANLSNISTALASYGQELTDAVNGAYFNGINVLDGSQSSTSVNFVSGFYASNNTPSGSTTLTALDVTTIGMNLQTLYSAASGANSAYTAGSGSTPGTGSMLVATGASGSNYDLTQLGTLVTSSTSTSTLSDMLTAVNSVLNNVTNYAATIGATQDRMSNISNLNSALTDDYANGVAGLVDADMNTASTRLQALQTQEQLGIQSLSIANQNAQLILKLFP